MIAPELTRLFSGTIGRTVKSLAGPRLIVFIAIGFLGVWGYAKLKGAQADSATVQRDQAVSERDQIQSLKEQLDRALLQVKSFNDEKVRRDTTSGQAKQTVTNDPTQTLDLPVPVSVLEQLRNSALAAARATHTDVGTDPASGD